MVCNGACSDKPCVEKCAAKLVNQVAHGGAVYGVPVCTAFGGKPGNMGEGAFFNQILMIRVHRISPLLGLVWPASGTGDGFKQLTLQALQVDVA